MITVFKETLTIAGFIFSMIIVVEYLNIMTRGAWQTRLRGGGFNRYSLAAFLGGLPGCLGGFVVSTLFSHRIVTFGALTACMVATTGDSAFLMLALFPGTAVKLLIVLIAIGVAAGWLTDALFNRFRKTVAGTNLDAYDLHQADLEDIFSRKKWLERWRDLTLQRSALLAAILFLLAGVLSGKITGVHWDPEKSTLFCLLLLDLVMVATASEHFLEKHLWEHAVKKHMPQVVLWTLGALTFIHFAVENNLSVELWIKESPVAVLFLAALIGLIPDASPQFIFVSLFYRGDISIFVLLANAIVQDGHGTLPLLAHSRKAFLAIKLLKLFLGLALGGLGLFITG